MIQKVLAPAALATLLSLGACRTMNGTDLSEPGIVVHDQKITGTTVTVDRAVSPGPGWVVIQAQENGAPGPVIGLAHLHEGLNDRIVVPIDVKQSTRTLYAVLHVDSGTYGRFEFPGPDAPISMDGKVIAPAFRLVNLP